ncbi:hypothetical protein CRM22_003727, partial [Opisthorchis felineus]
SHIPRIQVTIICMFTIVKACSCDCSQINDGRTYADGCYAKRPVGPGHCRCRGSTHRVIVVACGVGS